jgi:hypothetical protein
MQLTNNIAANKTPLVTKKQHGKIHQNNIATNKQLCNQQTTWQPTNNMATNKHIMWYPSNKTTGKPTKQHGSK